MAFLTTKDLRTSHGAIRKQTNIVSRHVFKLRKKVESTRAEVEKLYDNVKMSKLDKKNAIAGEMKSRVSTLTTPLKDEFTAPLRELEKHRLLLEAGRDTMTNPITRINALTMLDTAMSQKRANASIILANAGPAEIQLAAEASKSVNDLGTLAACVTRNSALKTSDRRFSNAEILKDVVLPDQAEVNAIYAEAVSVSQYALHCLRSLDNAGTEDANAKIERGLADRQVELTEDGSLKPFEFEDTTKAPDIKPKPTPKPEPKDVKPEDFESAGEYLANGGDTAFVAEHGDKFWEDLKAS